MTRDVTEAERLAALERDVRDHAGTLTAHNMALDSLEKESVERRIAAAAEGERSKALLLRLDAIERSVADFKKAVTRPLWAVAGLFGLALAGAFLKMTLAGSVIGSFLK